jgi:hypothetical protein
MTTETPKAAPKPPTETSKEEEQSFLPTVLAGAGILAVAALLIFWPSGDSGKEKNKDGQGKADAPAGQRGGEGEGDPSSRAVGVGSRQVDAATTPEGRGTRNPAIKLPPGGRGMAPMPEALPQDPPPDATPADKIAFYEKRLEQALRIRDTRKKFVDRLPDVQARVESSKNPAEGMEAFEKRKRIVEDNYSKAQADVEELEKKLAELRGS